MTEEADPLLAPDAWEAEARFRSLGLGGRPAASADLRRCWVFACLSGEVGELLRVRERLQAMWDALPDERYRACGNGAALRAFLAGAQGAERLRRGADPERWAALLSLSFPCPRPGA